MSIVKNIGIRGTAVNIYRTDVLKGMLAAYGVRAVSAASGRVKYPSFNLYQRSLPENLPAPPLPVYSDTADLYASITAMSGGTSDITADISTRITYSDIYGFVRPAVRTQQDIYGYIRPMYYTIGTDEITAQVLTAHVEDTKDIYGLIMSFTSSTKDITGRIGLLYPAIYDMPARLQVLLISTYDIGGIINGRRVYSTQEDIYSTVFSWRSSVPQDLYSNIFSWHTVSTLDIYSNIRSVVENETYDLKAVVLTAFVGSGDISVFIRPWKLESTYDAYANVRAVSSLYKDVSALVVPLYSGNTEDILANIVSKSLWESSLRAIINGIRVYSYTQDVTASLLVSQLPFYSYTDNLSASIISKASLYYQDIIGLINGRRVYSTYSDITAEVTVAFLPVYISSADALANVLAFTPTTEDMYSSVSGVGSVYKDALAFVRGLYSTHTEPLAYEESVIGTRRGLSILFRVLTRLPDITAYIAGWAVSDLAVFIFPHASSTSDITARMLVTVHGSKDIYASLISIYSDDIGAYLEPVPGSTLQAYLGTVPFSTLPSYIRAIPGVDIRAFGGGHPPKDLTASAVVNLPVPMSGYIVSGFTDVASISADVTGTGGWSNIHANVHAAFSSARKLYAELFVRGFSSLPAHIGGWALYDLDATIKGVCSRDINGVIVGTVQTYKDVSVFIRASFGGQQDVGVWIYGWRRTHTSDKLYNYNKFSWPAPRMIIGTRRGLTILRIEPIYGYFPDLHADITVINYYRSYIRASIRGTIPTTHSLTGTITAVTPAIYINKVIVNFVNVSNMLAYISAFSGYKNMSANIRGIVSTRTSTAAGSGWVYTYSMVKFHLGTTKGLFIPVRTRGSIRDNYFLNSSRMPDMWAYVYGWATNDITSSISVQPCMALYGSVVPLDTSHLSYIRASITSTYTFDITSSVSGVGYFDHLGADVTASGETYPLGATIKPYLLVLGFRVLPVETMPFYELQAIVNPVSSCGAMSTYSELGAFVRAATQPTGGSDFYAYIESSRDASLLSADIVGRKTTRIRVINLWFRTKTRSHHYLSSLVVGIGEAYLDMGADIRGISHTSDITASITPYRYKFNNPFSPLGTIDVYKLADGVGQLYKKVSMSFSNKVDMYIYDALNSAIYPLDNGRWALNLSTLTETQLFFYRGISDKSINIGSVLEYKSIDEAIRAAVVFLTEMRQEDIYASITGTGGCCPLRAYIYGKARDKVSDLRASLTIVNNDPDLYAYISAFSGFNPMKAYVVGIGEGTPDIDAYIRGVVHESLAASIVCV